LIFVTTALLKYGLGIAQPFDLMIKLFVSPDRMRIFNLISPLVFLGGLLAALVINLYPQINLRIRRDDSRLVATVIAQAKPINLAVVVLCGLLLAILAGHVALENFPGL
jgi:Zn-dependent protease